MRLRVSASWTLRAVERDGGLLCSDPGPIPTALLVSRN